MSYVTDLLEAGDRLFAKRENLLSFWQTCAENFSPVSADFTTKRSLGEDYASNLATSYPLLVARELIGQFGAMLRPNSKEAAVMYVDGLEDYDGKAFLDWATKRMRTAMYDKASRYVVAAKDGEHDFTLFGQSVMTVNKYKDRLLFQPWHLRDVAWADSVTGSVECVHRKWKNPTAYELARLFGEDKLHERVRDQLRPGKDPYCEVEMRHVVVPADMYHGDTKFRTELVSVFIDVEHEHIVEVTGQRINPYVIPRWQLIKGCQYATSPAVTCALPEARMLQAMSYTILEAGEKAVNPPLVAAQNAFRDDLDLHAGGINYYTQEYDERTGEVIRPIHVDKGGFPLSLELQKRSEDLLLKAFYVDKLRPLMPQGGREATAYEIGQLVQQYLREALPLVEPVEIEFNGGVWERAFEVAALNGYFGSPDTWPESLRGADIQFKFASPLRETVDRQKGRVFLDGVQLIQAGAALDPAVSQIPNAVDTMRDVLEGIGWETKWMRSPEAVQAAADHEAEQAQAEQMLGAMSQAAKIGKDLSGIQGAATA